MSVSEMARQIGMSRNGLSNRFVKITSRLQEFMLTKGINSIDDLAELP